MLVRVRVCAGEVAPIDSMNGPLSLYLFISPVAVSSSLNSLLSISL